MKEERDTRRFQRFIKTALVKAISDIEVEETLREYKEAAAQSAKIKKSTRKVVVKRGVLNTGKVIT